MVKKAAFPRLMKRQQLLKLLLTKKEKTRNLFSLGKSLLSLWLACVFSVELQAWDTLLL
jgi:hypothetical protein